MKFTTKDVAEMFDMKPRNVLRMVYDDVLHGHKEQIGKKKPQWVFEDRDIIELIKKA